jgi:Polyketide cyclase / dehydrase and lipid transport
MMKERSARPVRGAKIRAMTLLMAAATKSVSAPPERVREFLRDYRTARPRILTSQYRGYRVEEGGVGEGTVIAYTFASPGRSRDFHMRVEESDEGLFERDMQSSFVSNWTVDPVATGSSVTLEASWEGAGGFGGFFERLFAPMSLRRTYGQVLDKLAAALEG